MRILVAGEWADNAMEIPILTTWRELGHEVEIEIWPVGGKLLQQISRIQRKFGYEYTVAGNVYNARIRRAMDRVKPDVFFVFKGMNVWESTLVYAQSLGIYLVNYNPDHPFIFSGKGSGNAIVRNSIQHFDLHLTYSDSIKKLLSAYGVSAERVPFGFELPVNWNQIKGSVSHESSGAFVGNADSDRLYYLSRFLDAFGDRPFVVYGIGWEPLKARYSNLELRKPVYQSDFWKALRAHRFQLNLMRVHNLDAHNMRSVEALAAGAISLQPTTPDHSSWIQHGVNGYLFSNFEEAGFQGRSIMDLSQTEVDGIRSQAESTPVLKELSYEQLAEAILNIIQAR